MRRFLLAVLAMLTLAAPALAEPRVALVIGNSKYQGDLPKLPNPANDATLMSATLKKLGFTVIETRDADLAQMNKAIREFSDKLSGAGSQAVGLFFYAGHGLQIDGENWQDSGARSGTERANAIWKELLKTYEQPALDPSIAEALDAYVARRKEEIVRQTA